MTLPLPETYAPMEAKAVAELPEGPGWQYEPKWDGFRALVFRDGDEIDIRSKKGQPISRYFPEVVEAVRALGARRFVLDGEIVVPDGPSLSFDWLLQRIHPAESRVTKLATEHPATLIVFDLLVDEEGTALVDRPLAERRSAVEAFARRHLQGERGVRLSPAVTDIGGVDEWLRALGGGLDGIMAKRLDAPYLTGERTGMVKFKRRHTADCVVGGFRYASKGEGIGSLLLGLYDDAGLLHHVGFTSNFATGLSVAERAALRTRLESLVEAPGFTGNAPGGPSRWSTARSAEWQPLRPELVVEVAYDQFSGDRFRHGTSFERWRPDKAPRQCTLAQVALEARSAIVLLDAPKSVRRASSSKSSSRKPSSPKPSSSTQPSSSKSSSSKSSSPRASRRSRSLPSTDR
jgi:ATP-dependent DNA ligase